MATVLIAGTIAIVGFAAVIARHDSDDILERNREHAYLTDLIVLDTCRGKGIGRRLLAAAEAWAAARGATSMRVGVLSANSAAHALYRSAGFRDYEVVLEKRLYRRTNPAGS